MRTLSTLDYVVVVVYLAISLGAGLIWTRSAGRSMKDFFLSGRSLPWWLAGVSMAATNFSIDTPLAITKYVADQGVAGVWFFWSNGIAALLAAFLFSRLWSRADVVTDAELIELRYSGPSARALRLIKGIYFGLFINCYVLGWVLAAVIKVMTGVTDISPVISLGVCVTVAFAYTVSAGLKGVVWTDFFQYGVGLIGSIVLAFYALNEVGGLAGLLEGLDRTVGSAAEATRFIPPLWDADGGSTVGRAIETSFMPASVFMVYVCVQWWAHKYSDGGGKHIQRMLACKSEGHAQGATMFFAFMNYSIQVWPWIITALCSVVILGPLPDPEMGYPLLMAKLLPAGVLGLCVVTLLGAFMSTVDTHLNLGAAYFVNDIYKRFLIPDATERHYVLISRLTMVVMLAIAIVVGSTMKSIGDAWKFILSFAAGAGVTWVLRWFWWRVNAWSEISAMITSGIVAIWLRVAHADMIYTQRLLVVVAISTLVWVVVTYVTHPVDDDILVRFVRRIRPGSPGWRRVYRDHGLTPSPFLARAIVDWLIGLVVLFGANFGIGSFLLGRSSTGALLMVAAVAAGALLVWRSTHRPVTD